MNKAELIESIAAYAKLTKADASRALDGTLEAISKSLKKGEKVVLVGFGTFQINQRKARLGRNPRTEEIIKIPAKKVVKFKTGSELSVGVNKRK
jgi:DNA-binding protein HU-beta